MLKDIFTQVLPDQSQYKIQLLGKDEGVVYSANEKSDARILWALPDLENTDRTYITASTFFGRKRQRRYVRHSLAIVCDFDADPDTTLKYIPSLEDIKDRYYAAHLPLPELILATSTPGHYQAWNIFDVPLRIDCELMQAKITKVHDAMATALGADTCAVGVERWVRRPHPGNIVYSDVYSRTSWTDLCEWYDSKRIPKIQPVPYQKVTFIGKVLDTEAGQRIQEPAAEIGCRNAWAYGLGLSLYDAGIPDEVIHHRLHEWNKAIKEPLRTSEIEKIYRSVMSGRHHASARVLESLTGRSAQIKGWYKWAKPRDRRRDHLKEVGEDIVNDLLQREVVIESQKAWADRLGVAYRTFKMVLAKLRHEGIIEANVGRGRYSQSTYKLMDAYMEYITSASMLEAAAGAQDVTIHGNTKGHIAISPFKGTLVFLEKRRPCGVLKVLGTSTLLPFNNKIRAG